jgi:colicin import membrane protein
MESKELAVIVENSGVDKTKAQTVLGEFTEFFNQASEWETKTKGLVITDVSQTKEMALAREGRLQLKGIRVEAEKTKKKLKEGILVEGRFIDAIYNLIVGCTQPLENALLEKEKFAERIEEARIAKLKADRLEALAPYEVDTSYFDVSVMPEEAFQKTLAQGKREYEARVEAAKKAEADRIAREQAEADERARVRAENERLKKEAEERQRAFDAEIKKQAEERTEREKKEIAEKNRLIAEQREREEKGRAEREKQEAEREEQKAIVRAEVAKREAAEKAMRDKEAADALAKADAERKAKEDATRLAAAGDAEKMRDYIGKLRAVSVPTVANISSKAALEAILSGIARADRLLI